MDSMKFRLPSITRGNAALSFGVLLFALAIWAAAWHEPDLQERLFVLALMVGVGGILLFAFARPATSLLVSGGLFLLLKFISVTKLRYLESPLMPADFVYFARSSLVETLEHYPHLLWLGIAVCIIAPLVLVLVWRSDYRLLSRMRSWLRYVIRIVGVAACALALWYCLLPQGPFSSIYNKGLWNKLSDQAHLTNFFITIHDSAIRMPAMADDALAEKNWAATATPATVALPAHKPYPDIVQVLEESTFNPATYTACNIPLCKLPMFQADARTRGHGLLRTHTFGGGTWVSEFSVFSGMPQDIFGPAGMYAPFVLAPRTSDTLPKLLRRLGYLTVGIYPTDGGFLNGRNAYHAYGFDQFYDVHDLGLTMWHTTDAQMFAAAKRIYDKVRKPGQPVFIMVLTLEEHGPHDTKPLASLPAPYNHDPLHDLPPDQALNMETYLARVHDSDQGMDQLEHDFLDRPAPTVIVHFGDHLPSFGGLIRKMQRTLPAAVQPYKNNLTYYMIKSNFAGTALPSYPMLDIAYLPSMVLQAAGLPSDPYFSALTSLRNRCHGLYEDCPNVPLLRSYYTWTFHHLHELN